MCFMLLVTDSQWEGSQARNQPVKVGGSWPCLTTTTGVFLSRPPGSDSMYCLAAEETKSRYNDDSYTWLWCFQRSISLGVRDRIWKNCLYVLLKYTFKLTAVIIGK